jgi:16S rRNA (guanine966-N2)-methyltransferase
VRSKRKTANQVRIIGGQHRGRQLSFPDLPGLRPTGDRVRETLFNWLQPMLPGARCLDLFAGSGALGLEAASRGASEVVLLDRAPRVVAQLQRHIADLRLQQTQAVQADALIWLQAPPLNSSFDIVFVDPPFSDGLLEPCFQRLATSGLLTENARVYLEADVLESLSFLSPEWQLLREKKTGQVAYYLLARQ